MSATPDPKLESATYRNYLGVLVAYSIALGAIYLWGYWGKFSVNALEYIGLADVVKISIYPLTLLTISIGIGGAFGIVIGHYLPQPRSRLTARLILAITGLIYIGLLIAFVLVTEPIRWVFLAMLMSPLAVALQHAPIARRHMQNDAARVLIIGLAVIAPGMAYFKGAVAAKVAESGNDARFLDVRRSKVANLSASAGSTVYLGMLGDYHFVYERRSKLVASFKLPDGDPIFFAPAGSPVPKDTGTASSMPTQASMESGAR